MFRMFQGWLSMSTTSAGEGTLMVNPLFGKVTAYFLLRPFFQQKRGPTEVFGSGFIDSNNWHLEDETTSVLHGAVPANCQELNAALHPHLELQNSMTHVPQVQPGDYVAWHCDSELDIWKSISLVIRADVLDSDTRRRQNSRGQGRFKRHVYPGVPAHGNQR